MQKKLLNRAIILNDIFSLTKGNECFLNSGIH